MKLGYNIKKIRELKNISQEYMANNLKISQSSYSDLENNKTKLSTERLEKIAELLEINLNELFNFSDKNVFNNTFKEASKGIFNIDVEKVILESFEFERVAYKENIKQMSEQIEYLKGIIQRLESQ